MNDGQFIDPTASQVDALVSAAATDDAPIVMVNLLKFNDGPGRASYVRYAAEVEPHLQRVGASVLYVGDARQSVIGPEEGPWWDTVLLVQYPSRAKFLEMVTDPAYQAISTYRSDALETSGLVATERWDTA